MADPFLILGSLMTIIRIVEDVSRVVAQINRIKGGEDTRLETLALNIDTELKTFDAWTSNVAMNRISLPEAAQTQVEHASVKMKECGKKAQSKLYDYLSLASKEGRKGLGVIKVLPLHSRFEGRGYHEIKDMIELMRALNNNLKTLIPTSAPPPYPPTSNEEVETVGVPLRTGSMDRERRQLAAIGHPQSQGERDTVSLRQPPSTTNVTNRPLWPVCWQTMQLLARCHEVESQRLHHLSDRLFLWASGLDEDPLRTEALRDGPIHDCLKSCMIELLLAQERCLDELSPSSEVVDAKMNIQAVLATAEVAHLALDQWAAMLVDELEPADAKADVDYLEDLVDLMYDALPGVRLARHQQVLKNERARPNDQTTATPDNVNIVHNENTDVSTSALALEKMSDIIDKANVSIPAGPRLSKSLAMLQLYNRDAALDPNLSRVVDQTETQKVLMKLKSALDAQTLSQKGNKASLDVKRGIQTDNAEKALEVLEQTASYFERARSSEVSTI